MKQYGIAYTIFEFEGANKIKPFYSFKARPGNLKEAMEKISKKTNTKMLMSWAVASFCYGFVVRYLIG